MSEKYIRVSELGVGHRNPDVFNDPERAHGWNDLLRIIQSAPTYTPADILAGCWVPVTERLPEPGERVLVCCDGFVGEGFLASDDTWHRYDASPLGRVASIAGSHRPKNLPLADFLDGLTHWMPLPGAPGGPTK